MPYVFLEVLSFLVSHYFCLQIYISLTYLTFEREKKSGQQRPYGRIFISNRKENVKEL